MGNENIKLRAGDRCIRCGHDGYAHGIPSASLADTACDVCDCPRFVPDPGELEVLLGVPPVPTS